MAVRAKKSKTGFTLIETVMAGVILCGAVLALGAISTRSLSQARLNRQYETAMAYVEKQLALIDYVGIESFIDSGQMQGKFEEFEPGYYWKIATEAREIDNLYMVNIAVSWVERGHPYSISVDTMFNGTGEYIETSEQ
ncbi:MAG: type IV pilus modification PilV family protein [Planctomycetota bacterium]|jgi:Tfp pilus assembly protein PilV